MNFRAYLESIKNEDSPEGDFANDTFRDKSFPWEKADDLRFGRTSICRYLLLQGACRQAREAFINVWNGFRSHSKFESSKENSASPRREKNDPS